MNRGLENREFLPAEEGGDDLHEHLRRELLAAEQEIDELHKKRGADEKGVLFAESWKVPGSWLEFVEHGEEVLGLDEANTKRFAELCEKMLRGRLNDEDEKDALEEFVSLKERYDELRAQDTGDDARQA